jgi:hypothetical protein
MGKVMKSTASRSFGQRHVPDSADTGGRAPAAPGIHATSDEPLDPELERRRYRRVKVRLAGRFMRENQHEYPCYTNDISGGGVSFTAPVECKAGELIVAYIEEIGRVEGMVVRTYDNGFAILLKATEHKREKIIATLTWLLNRHELGGSDARRHERLVPSNPSSTLRLADGTEIETQIYDLSLGGARIAHHDGPRTGDVVVLGKTRGRIVRIDEAGIGIEFDREQSIKAIDHHLS